MPFTIGGLNVMLQKKIGNAKNYRKMQHSYFYSLQTLYVRAKLSKLFCNMFLLYVQNTTLLKQEILEIY